MREANLSPVPDQVIYITVVKTIITRLSLEMTTRTPSHWSRQMTWCGCPCVTGPKYFSDPNFFPDPKQFLDPNIFFGSTNYFGPTNIFGSINYLDQKIFLDPKFFFFRTQILFRIQHFCRTQHFFRTRHFFLTVIFFLTQHFLQTHNKNVYPKISFGHPQVKILQGLRAAQAAVTENCP